MIENNLIHDNDDDGIEIRLHEYHGDVLEIEIRGNEIIGNGEDGIQIIDYPDRSDRWILIEGNVLAHNAMAGIGCMSDGITLEDYRAADIPEPIRVVNNTFVGHQYGISGGDNLVALNNIIADNSIAATKKVDGDSILSHNLFWGNSLAAEGNGIGLDSVQLAPSLDNDFRPSPNSPATNLGARSIATKNGDTFEVPPKFHSGDAAIIGARHPR